MKNKIFILVLILSCAAVYLYNASKATEEIQTNQQAKLVLPTLDKDKVFYLGVSHKADVYEIEKQENRWMLIDPKGTPADESKALELVERLSKLSAERVLEGAEIAADDSAYGFNEPEMLIAVDDKKGKKELLITKKNPLNNKRYLKILGNENSIYIIGDSDFQFFEKNKQDIWDARPLFFKIEDLNEIEITEVGTESFSIKNEAEVYKISTNTETFLADNELTLKALAALSNLKITESPRNEISNLLANTLQDPSLIIKLRFENGKERSVFFGREVVKDSDVQNYYFKIKENPLIYRFSGSFLPDFFKGPKHFQVRKIFSNLEITEATINDKNISLEKEVVSKIKEIEVLSFVEVSKDYTIKTPELSFKLKTRDEKLFELEIGKSVGSLQTEGESIEAPRFAVLKNDGKKQTLVLSAKTLSDLENLAKK